MSLIDTRNETPTRDPRRERRMRRFRVLRALEDLAAGRVGLVYLPGAAAGHTRERRPGRP